MVNDILGHFPFSNFECHLYTFCYPGLIFFCLLCTLHFAQYFSQLSDPTIQGSQSCFRAAKNSLEYPYEHLIIPGPIFFIIYFVKYHFNPAISSVFYYEMYVAVCCQLFLHLYITLLLDAKPKLVWKNFPKMSVNFFVEIFLFKHSK